MSQSSWPADSVWELLKSLALRAKGGRPLRQRAWFALGSDGSPVEAPSASGSLWVEAGAAPAFGAELPLAPDVAQLVALYLPLCAGTNAERVCVAHLGQSLDGRIATASGLSRYVTGEENLTHLHRLRALCDAVVVGARTVERDDPELTTRRVSGENPVRVVIDPELRSPPRSRIFNDGRAKTLVLAAEGARAASKLSREVEVIELPRTNGALDPHAVRGALEARGLARILIEGGGITVSGFLRAGALDRLHVTVAPLILGSGLHGLTLPPIETLDAALRPAARRFDLGRDVLFDCELELPSDGVR